MSNPENTAWRTTLIRVGSLLFGTASLHAEPEAEPIAAEDSTPATPCGTCGADGCSCDESCTTKGCGCCDACKTTAEGTSAEPEGAVADEPPLAPDPPLATPEPCAQCGSTDCSGHECTGKGCGCCDGCVTAAEDSDDGEPEGATPTDGAAALVENARLRAALAAVLKGESPKLKNERTTRINTQVDNFMTRAGAHWGMEKRAVFQSLYAGVKLGVVSLRRDKAGVAADATESERTETLSAKLSAGASAILGELLEALAMADQSKGPQERVQAGGPTVDRVIARAGGDQPETLDEIRDRKIEARAKQLRDSGFTGNAYLKAHSEIAAEEASSGATK